MSNTKAAALNRAFNNADATVAAQAATVADLAANEIAAANKFDVPTLTDAELAKQVMTNMGFLPSTVAAITQLEIELAAYFGGMGKDNRGFVVLQLSDILSTLTADATYGAIATAWNAEVAASVASTVPGTFALTAATTDNLVGSSGDDIFTALTDALSTKLTLNATDKIAGGAGTDTLNVTLNTNFGGFTTGSVSAVETVNLTNATTAARAFDATGITGATSYSVSGDLNTTITDLATGANNFSITGVKSGAVSTAFASLVAETTGTKDVATLTLSTVGATSAVPVTLGSFETVNITSTGTNSITLGGTDATAVTVAGSGKLTLGSVPSSITSFDASASTGGVIATLTAAAAGAMTKVAAGSGDDTITYDAADGKVNATLTGGDGTDTLVLSAVGTNEFTQTGFETLTLSTVGSALTLSGAKTTDVKTVNAGGLVTAAVTMVNMGSGDLTFNTNATSTTVKHNSAVSSDHTGATTIVYNGGSSTATTDLTAANYTVDTSAGALSVTAAARTNVTTTVNAAKASSVSLTVTSAKDATEAATELTTFGGTINAEAATAVTVNATGTLGGTISAAAAKTANITNGAVTGALTLTAAAVTDLTVTSGATLNMSGSTLSGVQKATLTETKGTLTLPNMVKASDVTLAGSGTTSKIVLGNLSTGNDASVVLTATGLKGGLTVGTADANAGYSVTQTVTGVTGNVSLGAIGSNVATGDAVTINAENVGGTLSVGAITTKGAVTIRADGTSGAVSLGAISGGALDVDVSSTIAGTTYSTFIALTGATLALSTLQDNTVAVSQKTAGTGLAVAVTGGSFRDQVTVTGNSTTKTITVTGDLSTSAAGTNDTVTVDGSAGSAQTITISGLTGYESSVITGGNGADTINGGAGADRIIAGRGVDSISGGTGKDTFVINTGDSTAAAFDTIVDFLSGDEIEWGNGTMVVAATKTATTTQAAIDANGVATFTGVTAASTLAEKAAAVAVATADNLGYTAFFTHDSSTYMFIETGSGTTEIVVKLTGVALPSATLVDSNTGTGLSGFGS
jgi:S-layer protein